jgi:eukaryotic-like serine/threonine-protein kinase
MMQLNLSGAQIGDFAILAELGRGGMAVVYRARQVTLDRIVALKVLPPELTHDSSYVARFQQEARSAARLEHPHIVPIYEIGQAAAIRNAAAVSPALHYIAMKYIEGQTLKDLVGSEGALSLVHATRLLSQVGAALDYAHSRQVMHRDIKPSNIMVTGDDWVFLTDFGLARALGAGDTAGLTMAGTVMGTPEYMSPEQAQGLASIGPATDIYALGVVLYELLTGGFPFQADTPMGMLAARLLHDPRPPREIRGDLPLPVEDIIMRALAREPAARFASAGEMMAALHTIVTTAPATGFAATGETMLVAGTPSPATAETIAYARPVAVDAPAPHRPAAASTTIPNDAPAPPARSNATLLGLGIAGLLLLTLMAGGLFGFLELIDPDTPPEPLPTTLPPPDTAEVQTLLASAAARVAAGDLAAALDDYADVLERVPDNIAAQDDLTNLGWLFFDAQDYDAAGEAFAIVLAADPNCPDANYGYGRVLLAEDEYAEAVEYLAQAVDLDPEDAEKAAWLGEAYFFLAFASDGSRAKELAYENAIDAYAAAIELDPGSSFALSGMGWALENSGRSADAIAYFEQSLAMDADQDESYNGLGWSLYNLNRYREAIAAFEQALALDPDYVNAYYGLGNSYVELGEMTAARNAYAAALEIDPDADYVREALDELEE